MGKDTFRLIEINEGCMCGESCIYLTNCFDDSIIRDALDKYVNEETENPIFELAKAGVIMELVIDTQRFTFFTEALEHMSIDKRFDIYNRQK